MIVDVGDEADAAGVVFLTAIVEPLGRREMAMVHGLIGLS
jgi:hypothetical protein